MSACPTPIGIFQPHQNSLPRGEAIQTDPEIRSSMNTPERFAELVQTFFSDYLIEPVGATLLKSNISTKRRDSMR
jgi:hypothetical protein